MTQSLSLNFALIWNLCILGSVQLQIQAAIRSGKSPDAATTFKKGENQALRSRLGTLEADYKLGRLNENGFVSQKFDILVALEKIGETLTVPEKEFMKKVIINLLLIYLLIIHMTCSYFIVV